MYNISFFIVLLYQLFQCKSQYYHVSKFELTWDDAQQFCDTRCNSQLVSIHNSIEYSKVIDVITNVNSENTWIGLKKYINEYEWSDNTAIDYIPIDTNESLWSNNCIYISPQNNHQLKDEICSTPQQFLCDSCDNVINKYVLGSQVAINYASALRQCFDLYGTSLISIHTEKDYQEAIDLCKIYDQDCWIGLSDNETEHIWKWPDETTWDYGTDIAGGVYPWKTDGCGQFVITGQPDNGCQYQIPQNCAILSKTDAFRWDDTKCDQQNTFLCNKPSELCFQPQWYTLKNDSNKSILDECELNMYGLGSSMMIMANQWENSESLVIEYMFTITTSVDSGDTGIILDFISMCEYLYIGISKQDIEYKLFVATMIDEIYTIVNYRVISFKINTYYLLRILVTTDGYIQISVNDELQMSYNHDRTGLITNLAMSGYIGILNNHLSINGKYLYVSGSKILLDDKVSQFSDRCRRNISDTMEPSEDYSVSIEYKHYMMIVIFSILFVVGAIVIIVILGSKMQNKQNINIDTNSLTNDITKIQSKKERAVHLQITEGCQKSLNVVSNDITDKQKHIVDTDKGVILQVDDTEDVHVENENNIQQVDTDSDESDNMNKIETI